MSDYTKVSRHRALNKERRHQCTKDELTMLTKLYQHFGHDYESIAKEMNELFPTRYKPTSMWKNIIQRRGMTDINTSRFSANEFKEAYHILYDLIRRQRKHIWRDLCMHFPTREVWVIQNSFMYAMSNCAKNLVCIYGEGQNKHLYYHRLRYLSQITWMVVLYLSSYNPNVLDLGNTFIKCLFDGCRSLEHWLRILIDEGLGHISDYSEFVRFNSLQHLPEIESAKFDSVIELVLTLDTIIRVCNSLTPYESIEFAGRSTQRHRKARKLLEKQILEQRLEQEYSLEIPERQVFVPYDIQRLKMNRTSNPAMFTKLLSSRSKNFLPLSKYQQRIIINSQEAIALLPFLGALDQSSYPNQRYLQFDS